MKTMEGQGLVHVSVGNQEVMIMVTETGRQHMDIVSKHLENNTFTVKKTYLHNLIQPPMPAGVVTLMHIVSNGDTRQLLVPVVARLNELVPGCVCFCPPPQ